MTKVSRRVLAEAVAAHLYFTDVHKTPEYVRDREEYIRSVASYLLETRRTGELDSILRDISTDWARVGYVEVLARSVHSLDDAARQDIIAQVKPLYPDAEQVVVTEIVDPTVVGGVRLSVADKQLDLSVEAKLNKFKQLVRAGKE
ncbi:MAG TPA: F0F1 ATP synthase subunit delta [Candidatus Saccharimonadia bacterium]|nr:F0F1 ATP synthase subunit delta [Candidatus Saccharimonadia bacterium]